MNFVQLKKSFTILPLATLLLGIHPSTTISEPLEKPRSTTTPAISILYSGITKLDTSNTLLLKINSENPDDMVSVCSDERVLLDQKDGTSTLQWKP